MKHNAPSQMPVARSDLAPSLQSRRPPTLPLTARQPVSRVLQTRHAPQQLSLFPMIKPTRPIDAAPLARAA